MHIIKKSISCLLSGLLLLCVPSFGTQQVQAASLNQTYIHFITINDNNDAILIESTDSSGNTVFGMVDSGEDTNGPASSTNGTILQGNGYEKQVIQFLKKKGVTSDNFVFYIGTHPHSDHIGSADEIIREFKPARVYIQAYADKYIADSAALWDNQIIYNDMLQAADEADATIIQTFNTSAPVDPATVSLNGSILWDDNENEQLLRPESLTLELSDASGSVISTCQTSITDGSWTYSFCNLPKRTDSGKTIDYQNTYTLTVKNVPDNYHVNVDSAANTITFTLITTDDGTDNTENPENSDNTDIPDNTAEPANNAEQPATENAADTLLGAAFSVADTDSTNSYEAQDDLAHTTPSAEDMVEESVLHAFLEAHPEIERPVSLRGAAATVSPYQPANNVGAGNPAFTLGSAAIEIMNYESTPHKVPDANHTSLGVLVTSANGKTAFLGGDINNLADGYIDPSTGLDTGYDESKLAKQFAGTGVDVLKLGHHGIYGSNTYTYLTTMNPSIAIITGSFNHVADLSYTTTMGGTYSTLKQLLEGKFGKPCKLYATTWYASACDAVTIKLDTVTAQVPSLSNISYSDYQQAGYYLKNGSLSAANGWIQYNVHGFIESSDKDGCWFYFQNSPYPAAGWQYLNNKWYYFANSGVMFTGWQSIDNEWYYFDDKGIMATGWIENDGNWFYLNDAVVAPEKQLGIMLHSGWYTIEGKRYYFNTSGKWIQNYVAPGWKQDANGWWYQNEDGSYPVSAFQMINGKWYYFNAHGYRLTGWQNIKNDWYMFNDAGVMLTGWVSSTQYCDPTTGKWIPDYQGSAWKKDRTGWWLRRADGSYPANQWEYVDGAWYYFNNRGYMMTDWVSIGGTWYYLSPSGAMVTGWLSIGGTWYYFNSDGAMCTGWQLIHDTWYYLRNSGAMATGWLNLNGTWYYLNSSGAMVIGWLSIGDTWYLMDTSGAMLTGWQMVHNTWYYLYPNGAMAANTYIGSYYVNASGAWVP